MQELSLNILDVAENSTTAGATLAEITVKAESKADRLTIIIKDNGKGMSPEVLQKVTDPFYTTRTTRKVGMGTSLFKLAAESTGGTFKIVSAEGVGTTVTATFGLRHIDRCPLGDMTATILSLVTMHPDTDWVYIYDFDGKGFTLDTREFKEQLGGVPLNDPDVISFMKDFLNENHAECGLDEI
jgi:anti-sigma regulatory factor (Ser/Thr protein kinase)